MARTGPQGLLVSQGAASLSCLLRVTAFSPSTGTAGSGMAWDSPEQKTPFREQRPQTVAHAHAEPHSALGRVSYGETGKVGVGLQSIRLRTVSLQTLHATGFPSDHTCHEETTDGNGDRDDGGCAEAEARDDASCPWTMVAARPHLSSLSTQPHVQSSCRQTGCALTPRAP